MIPCGEVLATEAPSADQSTYFWHSYEPVWADVGTEALRKSSGSLAMLVTLRAPSLVRRSPDTGPTDPRSRRTRALALRSRTMKQTGVTKNLKCYKTIRVSPGCSNPNS